jgi:RHS repeat-associated protein
MGRCQSIVLGTTPTDFNFTGLCRHSKSNLDLAVYRAYDPDLGRWLNRDPFGENGGLNLYGYVGNDPIRFIDLSGEARTLRDYINVAITAGTMFYQAWTGGPTDIQVPRTPTSQRAAEGIRMYEEQKNRRLRKPKASTANCIGVLWDPFEDLDLILDYDVDKTFEENLRDKYGPPHNFG